VGKLFSLISVLVALAVPAFLWSQHSSQVREDAPTAILQAATTALELNHRVTGTYAGASLDGVTLVSAGGTAYCIEVAGYHLAGPGGAPTAGTCPR
jgi:hypothetical protein